MKCVVDENIECIGPISGDTWWVCPLHGASLTEAWTENCRTDIAYRQAWINGNGPGQNMGKRGTRTHENPTPKRKLLGDRIGQSLTTVGVTEERVTNWLGRPCGCGERKRKLNLLHAWAEKQLRGLFSGQEQAIEELQELIEENQV